MKYMIPRCIRVQILFLFVFKFLFSQTTMSPKTTLKIRRMSQSVVVRGLILSSFEVEGTKINLSEDFRDKI
jgi:hypothetical protein